VDDFIELGLSKLCRANSEKTLIKLTWLIDQLLEMIAENLGEGSNSKDKPFRDQLEKPRQEILSAKDNSIKGSIAWDCLDACSEQFKQFHIKRLERDENFAEIIMFLRETLTNLVGESKAFHNNLLDTTERIRRITAEENVRELKSKITAEVSEIRRIVSEKQKREQTQHEQLSGRISVLQQKLQEAKTEASLDGLTGIANRRNFDFALKRWTQAHSKSETPFTVALIDLDNFKKINDTYGHQIGDQVLAFAARELSNNIRSSDFLARYGGEEFAILSSGMKLIEAKKRYAQMLRNLEVARFTSKNLKGESLTISFTASCGIAEYALGEAAEEMIRRADEALYEAKRQGKNCVSMKRRPLLSAFYEGRKRNPPAE
jgi:diguanylate cyclase (GGDEF)-like protein